MHENDGAGNVVWMQITVHTETKVFLVQAEALHIHLLCLSGKQGVCSLVHSLRSIQ
jgi:hypothetical protein